MKPRNRNKADWATGKQRARQSLRLVNEYRIPAGDVKAMAAQLQTLGTTLWVGWTGNDFDTNHMTLRQYVRIPRILSPAKNN